MHKGMEEFIQGTLDLSPSHSKKENNPVLQLTFKIIAEEFKCAQGVNFSCANGTAGK